MYRRRSRLTRRHYRDIDVMKIKQYYYRRDRTPNELKQTQLDTFILSYFLNSIRITTEKKKF